MSWQNLADMALKAGIRTFKTSGVYTRLAAPSDEIEIDGVFDTVHRSVDPETGVPVSSKTPTFGIRLEDLPAAPDAGDQVVIRTVAYEVIESQEDGEGGAKLILVRKS